MLLFFVNVDPLLCISRRDAEDAVHARDGYDYDGYRLRVEFPRGTGPSNYRSGGSGGGGGRGRDGGRGNNRGPPTRRTNHRVVVTGTLLLLIPHSGGRQIDNSLFLLGLPPSGSWQDLKDHMREAGDVCYADVFKDGTGVVEFIRYDDMKYALRKLDDSRFRSHEVRITYCSVMSSK